jgi:hypothetical protein
MRTALSLGFKEPAQNGGPQGIPGTCTYDEELQDCGVKRSAKRVGVVLSSLAARSLALCAFAVVIAAGQTQQPESTPGPNVKFTANSNLVIVDVMVRDKSGKPMAGLKQGDFTVLEDGKPQKIPVFEYQQLRTEPQPPPKLTLADELKLPEAPKTSITAEQPGQSKYRDKRLMVFFLDFSSMGMNEQLRRSGRGPGVCE